MVTERDFDLNHVSKQVFQLAKEHEINYDRERIIPNDNSLADDLWEAGLSLFLRSGIYYLSTRRIIRFTEDEVKEALRGLAGKIAVGEGKDRREITNRVVEDPKFPTIFAGPFGADVSQEMFIKLNQAYAQEPSIDVLFMPGHLSKIKGVAIRVNSPLEVEAALRSAQWTRKAIELAGREGMPVAVQASGISGLAEMVASNPEWGFRRSDPRAVLFLPELKTSDPFMARAAHYIDYGCPIYGGFTTLIGGYGGGPNSTAIAAIAHHIAALLVFKADIVHLGPQHILLGQQSNPMSLWEASITAQAVARNSRIIRTTSATVSGRPFSKQMFYEAAALAVSAAVGGSNLSGPRSAKPIYENHVSPLDARFFAEVGRAATRIKREDANDIVKELLKRYEDKIRFEKAPVGKPFEECYNVQTLTPKEEYVELYSEAKKEMENLGVSFI